MNTSNWWRKTCFFGTSSQYNNTWKSAEDFMILDERSMEREKCTQGEGKPPSQKYMTRFLGRNFFLYVYNTESGVGSEHWKSLHHQQSKIPSESLLYQIKKIRVLEGDFITETNV